MAKATVTVIPPAPVKPVKRITLELSEAETLTLAIILRNIGGSRNTSARKYSHDIQLAIPAEYMTRAAESTAYGCVNEGADSIYFTNESKAFVESV